MMFLVFGSAALRSSSHLRSMLTLYILTKVDLWFSTKSIEFLDTLVKLEAGHIYTDLYVKSRDKQLYLRKDSCHSPNIKQNRWHTSLVFESEIYVNEKMTIKSIVEPSKLSLEDAVTAVHSLRASYRIDKLESLSCCLIQMKAKKLDRVPLVLTYSSLLLNVHEIV